VIFMKEPAGIMPAAKPSSLRLFDRGACLLEVKHEVVGLKGPSAYPSAMVIAEALLIDC
jgi:hypothetical protein